MVQPSKPVSLGNIFGTSIMSVAVRDMEGTQRKKKMKKRSPEHLPGDFKWKEALRFDKAPKHTQNLQRPR